MIFPKCDTCGTKTSRFIKKQKVKGVLSNLVVKTPLSKVSILRLYFLLNAIPLSIKMNAVINKFFYQGINLCQKCI